MIILIVSKGRDSLNGTLDSIFREIQSHDKVILILDGVFTPSNINKHPQLQIIEEEYKGMWGHPHREKYQSSFKGDYILNFDDDDVMNLGWRSAINTLIARHSNPDMIVFNYVNLNLNKSVMSISNTINCITGNVVFKNIPELTTESWGGYGGDNLRCSRLINTGLYNVVYSEFALFNKN